MTQRVAKDASEASAAERPGGRGPDVSEDGLTLLPLCDVAGYACFVTWAFMVGWDRGVSPLEGPGGGSISLCCAARCLRALPLSHACFS